MIKNNFSLIRSIVRRLQYSITQGFSDDIAFNNGKLVAISDCGYKIDKVVCRALLDIYSVGDSELLNVYSGDINLDDFGRILRYRNSLY